MEQVKEVTLSMDLIHRLGNKVGERPYTEVAQLLNELNVVVGQAQQKLNEEIKKKAEAQAKTKAAETGKKKKNTVAIVDGH